MTWDSILQERRDNHFKLAKMSGGFLALQQKRTRERKKLVELEDAFKERVCSFCTLLLADLALIGGRGVLLRKQDVVSQYSKGGKSAYQSELLAW